MDAIASKPLDIEKTRKRMPTATLTDRKIIVPAIWDAFKKLDPRIMVKNPVMFSVELVAALTTILFFRDPTWPSLCLGLRSFDMSTCSLTAYPYGRVIMGPLGRINATTSPGRKPE